MIDKGLLALAMFMTNRNIRQILHEKFDWFGADDDRVRQAYLVAWNRAEPAARRRAEFDADEILDQLARLEQDQEFLKAALPGYWDDDRVRARAKALLNAWLSADRGWIYLPQQSVTIPKAAGDVVPNSGATDFAPNTRADSSSSAKWQPGSYYHGVHDGLRMASRKLDAHLAELARKNPPGDGGFLYGNLEECLRLLWELEEDRARTVA
jgi:hypothetical protein